jgi:hypothetical protein
VFRRDTLLKKHINHCPYFSWLRQSSFHGLHIEKISQGMRKIPSSKKFRSATRLFYGYDFLCSTTCTCEKSCTLCTDDDQLFSRLQRAGSALFLNKWWDVKTRRTSPKVHVLLFIVGFDKPNSQISCPRSIYHYKNV